MLANSHDCTFVSEASFESDFVAVSAFKDAMEIAGAEKPMENNS
jgi:hypothetical protein